MAAAQQAASADRFDERDARALTGCMVVYAEDPDAWGEDEVAVYSGETRYVVNLEAEYCDCPDNQYRNIKCKHIRRAEFELGRRDIPDWVAREAVDAQLLRALEVADDD